MKKTLRLSIVMVFMLGVNAPVMANETVDKAKDGIINLFEKAKDVTVDTAKTVVEKGAEIGAEGKERAKESGSILMEKAKAVGESTSNLVQKGVSKLKGDECAESDLDCQNKLK